MFAVLNKDVKSSAYLSVLVCSLIIPLLGNAHELESKSRDIDNHYSSNTVHESYEDYLQKRSSHISATKIRLEKTSTSSSRIRISSSGRKKISSSKKIIFAKYTVKRKDTLTKIAKKFNTTVSTIQKYNGLNDKHSIKIGMVLKVPAISTIRPKIKKSNNNSYSISSGARPRFRWPMPHVVDYKNDGLDGVKSIGIIITGIPGSKVLSSAAGTVTKICSMRGFGKYIVINHAGRFNTVYANLNEIRVSEGHTVQSGIIIGKIHSSEKKLHFQIDLEGKPENPLKYLPKNI